MRKCVAAVVAALLATSKSNNLWFHLFDPVRLKGTYIPGFLVSLHQISIAIINIIPYAHARGLH